MLLLTVAFIARATVNDSLLIFSPERVVIGTNAVVQPMGDIEVTGHLIFWGEHGGTGSFRVLQCCEAFHFQWMGELNRKYRVETSTNMITWTPTGAKILGAGMMEEWYEPVETNSSAFFRIVLMN